jgi:hypothetical protein
MRQVNLRQHRPALRQSRLTPNNDRYRCEEEFSQ